MENEKKQTDEIQQKQMRGKEIRYRKRSKEGKTWEANREGTDEVEEERNVSF